MLEAPQIVQTARQPTAVIRLTIPRAEMQAAMGPGLAELHQALAERGVEPTGPWFTHHLRMDPDVFDFEIGLPVAEAITPSGRVAAGELAAARVARAVYSGPFEGLGAAWGELDAWIVAGGHRAAADLWERYLAGPEASANPSDWRTELNRPLVGD